MIRYVEGDATAPYGADLKIICHICNDRKAWGAGFVLAISRRWHEPELIYRQQPELVLGEVMFVPVENEVIVANMVAQRGFPTRQNPVAVDYAALENCLLIVASACREKNASVHMPRIGCGIGGGLWDKVEEIIGRTLTNVSVTVYDLPS